MEDKKQKQAEILNTQKSVIVSFLNKGLPRMAHKELRDLLRKYPNDADFKNLMGLTMLALENPQKAATFFKKSLKLNKRTAVALNLSSAYIEAGQHDRAIRLLLNVQKSTMAKTYRFPERIAHNIALAAERKKDWQLAERFYAKALSENPNYYLSLMRLGQLFERTDRPRQAIKRFLTARSICNRCFDPVNGLVMNYLAVKAPKRAMTTIKVFLQQKEIDDATRERAEKLLQMTKRIASNFKSTPNPKQSYSKSQQRKSRNPAGKSRPDNTPSQTTF
jgi:tetratricopeptide (TPR) repeat protein